MTLRMLPMTAAVRADPLTVSQVQHGQLCLGVYLHLKLLSSFAARLYPPLTGSCHPTLVRMSFGSRCSPSRTTGLTMRQKAAGGL